MSRGDQQDLREFSASVRIGLKPGILDPQGEAVGKGLAALGFTGVKDLRVGKWITFRLSAPSCRAAEETVATMCRRLLANPSLEQFEFEVTPVSAPGAGEAS